MSGCAQRDLEVRGVALGERHAVLAGRTRRHVLVGAGAAHHPHVALDAVEAQAGALHDAVVRPHLAVVADGQSGGVAVERVGVLHHELARAQHPRAGAGLVALLDLEVVERQRQVAVGAHRLGDVEGDRLLVGHREHELRALAVGELEELLDLQAPGLAPRLGGLQHGHQHLLCADRVHLLADDGHDTLVHAPTGGQPRPHAGAHLPDEPGAHHQLVRDRLRVGGGLPLGGQQVLGETGHRGHILRTPIHLWIPICGYPVLGSSSWIPALDIARQGGRPPLIEQRPPTERPRRQRRSPRWPTQFRRSPTRTTRWSRTSTSRRWKSTTTSTTRRTWTRSTPHWRARRWRTHRSRTCSRT